MPTRIHPLLRLTIWLTLLPVTVQAQSFWDMLSRSAQQTGQSDRMSSETVTIINADGRSFTKFSGTRTGGPLDLYMPSGSKPSDYSYFFPHNVRVQSHNRQTDLFKIPPGGYSSMSTGTFSTKREAGKTPDLVINEDGSYTFNSWDGKTYDNNGNNYGQWAIPHNFRYFAVAWVLPENIEVIRYSSNRDRSGQWQYKAPVLSFIGSNLNNFTYTVTYRVREAELIEAQTLP